MVLNTLFYEINVTLKSRLKEITKRHEAKLISFNLRRHNLVFSRFFDFHGNT